MLVSQVVLRTDYVRDFELPDTPFIVTHSINWVGWDKPSLFGVYECVYNININDGDEEYFISGYLSRVQWPGRSWTVPVSITHR